MWTPPTKTNAAQPAGTPASITLTMDVRSLCRGVPRSYTPSRAPASWGRKSSSDCSRPLKCNGCNLPLSTPNDSRIYSIGRYADEFYCIVCTEALYAAQQ